MIHRYWEGAAGPPNEPWTTQAIEHTLGQPVRTWACGELPPFVYDKLRKRPPGQVKQSDRRRHASNIIRYALLWEFGGLWLDCDVIPLRKFPTGEPWVAGLFGAEGAVMYFPQPHHPMLLDILADIKEQPRSNRSSASVSGAVPLNRHVRAHGIRVENNCFSHDSSGSPNPINDPLCLHLWSSSCHHRIKETAECSP